MVHAQRGFEVRGHFTNPSLAASVFFAVYNARDVPPRFFYFGEGGEELGALRGTFAVVQHGLVERRGDLEHGAVTEPGAAQHSFFFLQ